MFPYGPHWFASVMGTGIVAVGAAGLPFTFPGQEALAITFWALDVLLFLLVTAATAVYWRRDRALPLRQLDDPVMSHFYGAPAMGLMTLGAATMVAGCHVVGAHPALVADWILWSLGTALGLSTAVAVPYRAITVHETLDDSAFGGWFMPLVPPMVSAATGAALVPHLGGQAQRTMVLGCYACFGLTLLATVLTLTALWQRLLRHGLPAAGVVPTIWIALGPLGQSVTAAHHLGLVAGDAVPGFGDAFRDFAVLYGVPVWGFAMLWLALAALLTARTARAGMPFALTWWSFTFPVGTLVTGTSGLASLTGLDLLDVAAGALYVLLLAAWATVAARTALAVLRPAPPTTVTRAEIVEELALNA